MVLYPYNFILHAMQNGFAPLQFHFARHVKWFCTPTIPFCTPCKRFCTPTISFCTPCKRFCTPTIPFCTPCKRFCTPTIPFCTPCKRFCTPRIPFYTSCKRFCTPRIPFYTSCKANLTPSFVKSSRRMVPSNSIIIHAVQLRQPIPLRSHQGVCDTPLQFLAEKRGNAHRESISKHSKSCPSHPRNIGKYVGAQRHTPSMAGTLTKNGTA